MTRINTTPIYQSYGGQPSRWNWHFIGKRAFDMTACIIFLPLLLPVMALIALIIMLDSPGNPIFVQERIGRRGRRFKIYKFRTMKPGIDTKYHRQYMQAYIAGELQSESSRHARPVFKPLTEQDYTRVGYLLRKYSLDELLQVFNVLKGEMSLVGPRPNVPWEVEKYNLWHTSRLDVLPGITGLAQVNGRSTLTFDEIVRNDLRYVMKHSFILDFKILWLTLRGLLSGHGAS
jgi:lipopolysaccharide/colanic/teichoic acid biosynthesis glycosyltransferase